MKDYLRTISDKLFCVFVLKKKDKYISLETNTRKKPNKGQHCVRESHFSDVKDCLKTFNDKL